MATPRMLIAAACLCASGWIQPPPAQAQHPAASAHPLQGPIRLDGNLDEQSWRNVPPIGDLTQVTPKEGEPSTEKTEIRVLFDESTLYFGVLCRDQTPSEIVATQLTRDAELDVDDHLVVLLDPFFDRRNGFFFVVNPAGSRADGQISNNAEHPSFDWDGIWNAAARITPEGWQAEIAIPFKTLRFKPGQTVWGLNVQREIKRRNETVRWAGARRDVWITNLAEAGDLENLPLIHQGRGLDVRPYGLVRNQGGDWKADGGLDLSKNLAPNLNASLTIRTDFAETEVDARQVNLTRFDLFYPEKRPFFLEGAGVFDTAGSSAFHPDLLPFFSRTIGLYDDQEVPILAGIKVTGRQSRYNIGLLDVQTEHVDALALPSQNLFVARLSRDFWRQSYVGGIFTRGNPSGQGSNSLWGVDARLATSSFKGNKNLSLDLYLFRTRDGAADSSDYAGGLRIDYPNDLWDVVFSWKQIGRNFIPALGFVPRSGMRKTNFGMRYGPRPETGAVRQLSFEFRPELITDLENVVQNWSIETSPLGIEFESGDRLQVGYSPEFERLEEPFEISPGIVIPAGSYTWQRYSVEAETASKRPWVVGFEFSNGTFYTGTRRQTALRFTIKPNRHFAIRVLGERNDIRLEEGRFFTQLVSLRADYNVSPDISWQNLIQYDNESRILGFQSRFRWILRPGNDLYLVLNRGWFRTFDRTFVSSYDRGTVKLAYTFRF